MFASHEGPRRMIRSLVVAVLALGPLLALGPAAPASAAPGDPGSTVSVGIKPLDPFVTRNGETYGGFSIDLWNEIARRNNWTTKYVWHDDLKPLLSDTEKASVDAAIAGISITKEREQTLDFSYPMFNAGLEVMVSDRSVSQGWASELTSFVAPVGRYVAVLVIALVVAGHVVWLATRRRTGRGYLPGVGQGIYKAAGLGLVGDYGVGEPERPIARLVAVLWTIVGICFVSLFTATVTSQLTVQRIQSSIQGVKDLGGVKVVTIQGSSAAAYLTKHDIRFATVGKPEEAFAALDDGTYDAVVFDAPVLEHRISVRGGGNELVVGGVFAHEDYGIAFPTGSALRKKVNTTLLEMRADGSYDDLYTKYFGASASGG